MNSSYSCQTPHPRLVYTVDTKMKIFLSSYVKISCQWTELDYTFEETTLFKKTLLKSMADSEIFSEVTV
jgi:hypothetical protein